MPPLTLTSIFSNLVAHMSATSLVMFGVVISITLFTTLMSMIDLIKEIGMGPEDYGYMKYAEKRAQRDRYRDRYNEEQQREDDIEDGLTESSDHEALGEPIGSDPWELDEFPDMTGSEDDGPDF